MSKQQQQKEEVSFIVAVENIKMIKLVSGDSLIAMVEFDKDDNSNIRLYNPYRLVFENIAFGNMSKTQITMEEYLPYEIVVEQLCDILVDDVVTMVDVNPKFAKAYTASVLKRVQLDELVRRGTDLIQDKLASAMKMSEEEENEIADEQAMDEIHAALKKIRDNYN